MSFSKRWTMHDKCEIDYIWSPSTCICENSKYLKSIADTIFTECHEIIVVTDSLSTKKTNTITTNDASTASINCPSKNVSDYYLSLTALLTIILILIKNKK